MVAALWSNSAFDEAEDKNARRSALSNIESGYEEALLKIERASSGEHSEEEFEIDQDNPFFAAAKRGMKKFEEQVGNVDKPMVDDEIEYMKGLDQAG